MKVCLIAPHILPWLSDTASQTAGGAELQQVFIGRGLRDKGYDVSYISLDYGQEEGIHIGGIKIYKSFKPNDGLFGIRFFYPRLWKIWKALRKADAHIYYVRCATFLVGIVAIFCKFYKKKFIYAGAHVTDFIPNQLRLATKRDLLLYKYGLRHADSIIAQSNDQKRLLLKHFGLRSKVITNFFPHEAIRLPDSQRKFILWVSTIRTWKRPIQFIRLAKSFPCEEFVMIGGPTSTVNNYLFNDIKRCAIRVKNLRFLGFQPFEVTENYFDRSKIFVNTSQYEGFPNTFLQAWCRGIPVISYVDPDNVIQKNALGLVVHSEQDLQHKLWTCLSESMPESGPILEYFKRKHSYKVIEDYYSLLDQMR